MNDDMKELRRRILLMLRDDAIAKQHNLFGWKLIEEKKDKTSYE